MNEELSFLREDEARQERWARITEGVEDPYMRSVIEQLCDNTAAMVRGTLPKGGQIAEATNTGAVAAFNRVAYPMIRRIYQDTVMQHLVSIQPMSLPVQLVFFLDFIYGSDKAPTKAGDRTDYEARKHNKFYASGAVRGELLGTGNGTETNFQLALYPVKPGSVTVYVDGVADDGAQVDFDTGAVVLSEAAGNGAAVTADYSLIQEGLGTRGNAEIARIGLRMSSAQVGVENLRLGAEWTIETEQDMMAYHGLSAERELVRHMADEIRREVDRLVIDDLYENATAGNVNWSKAVPSGTKMQDHYETLLHAIGDASTEIYKKRLRHANFVVMAPDTLNMLDKINSFRVLGAGADGKLPVASIASGPNIMGTLANRYRVIVDPLFPTDKVLIGYKGDSMAETGYVYAPYVTFQTQTFTDPLTMTPAKGLMTRFGRHLVDGDFYATVTITA